MGCNPEDGYIRELMDESELKKYEILFKHGEVIDIKGCTFKVIQIVGSPHNTITLQSISKLESRLEGLSEKRNSNE